MIYSRWHIFYDGYKDSEHGTGRIVFLKRSKGVLTEYDLKLITEELERLNNLKVTITGYKRSGGE